MVLTKSELLESLRHEVHVLLHLASKIRPSMLDYRPTPKQRSTIELLKYLAVMGPELVKAAKRGGFDPAAWTEAEKAVATRDFEGTVATIREHAAAYAALLADMTDEDFRTEIDMFGSRTTRGKFIVGLVLGGCAAYRTQLFVYLKACGREELSTLDLWAGVDGQAAAV